MLSFLSETAGEGVLPLLKIASTDGENKTIFAALCRDVGSNDFLASVYPMQGGRIMNRCLFGNKHEPPPVMTLVILREANWRDKLDRAEKAEFVTAIKGELAGAGSVVVAHYAGLTVADMTELRSAMRAAGGTVKVAKNRLVKLALEGSEAEGMSALFQGQTLIAYAEDPVAAPKAAAEFAKKNDKLVLLGGAMGPTVLDESGIKALATMPSLDELRGKLIGMITTPAQRIAMVTSAPAGQVARVIGAYSSKEAA